MSTAFYRSFFLLQFLILLVVSPQSSSTWTIIVLIKSINVKSVNVYDDSISYPPQQNDWMHHQNLLLNLRWMFVWNTTFQLIILLQINSDIISFSIHRKTKKKRPRQQKRAVEKQKQIQATKARVFLILRHFIFMRLSISSHHIRRMGKLQTSLPTPQHRRLYVTICSRCHG